MANHLLNTLFIRLTKEDLRKW